MTNTENVFDGFALLGDDEEFDVDNTNVFLKRLIIYHC